MSSGRKVSKGKEIKLEKVTHRAEREREWGIGGTGVCVLAC